MLNGGRKASPTPDSEAKSSRFNRAGVPAGDGILVPAGRWDRGVWLFRDSTLRRLEILLDEAFRVPFTKFRFGIDGIIGLVPGLGDVVAGLLSLIIPIAAWVRGVPYITLFRMAVNVGIGVLVGSIPVLGDAFDIAFKPNRRNYQLLLRSPGRTASQYVEGLGVPDHARVRAGDRFCYPSYSRHMAIRVAYPTLTPPWLKAERLFRLQGFPRYNQSNVGA